MTEGKVLSTTYWVGLILYCGIGGFIRPHGWDAVVLAGACWGTAYLRSLFAMKRATRLYRRYKAGIAAIIVVATLEVVTRMWP